MPKKKNPIREFAGALDKPISIKNLSGVPKKPREPAITQGEDAEKKYQAELEDYKRLVAEAVAKAAIEKMPLLLQRYQISQDDEHKWELLSFKLAIEFVRGFSLDSTKPAGPRKKWHVGTFAALYLDVFDRCKDNPKINLESMFHELSKEEPWKSLCKLRVNNDSKGSGKNLHNIYNNAMSGEFGKLIEWLDTLPVPNVEVRKREFLEIIARRTIKDSR